MPKLVVLVPVLNRPQRIWPLWDSFAKSTDVVDARMLFLVNKNDTEEIKILTDLLLDFHLVENDRVSWAKKINDGFSWTSEPLILLGADDLRFHTDWMDEVKKNLDWNGVLGTNDLGNEATMRGQSSTHPIVSRSYIEKFGTEDEPGKILHEGYRHNYPDTELSDTAKKRGRYKHLINCIVEHLHPAWGKAEDDATYQLGRQYFEADRDLYFSRKQKFGWT